MTNPASPQQAHFLVSGEVQYTEIETGESQVRKTNGIFVTGEGRIPAKGLGEIQRLLQMQFHQEYSKTHAQAPDVTNVIIYAVSFIGGFTAEEFHAGTPEQP